MPLMPESLSTTEVVPDKPSSDRSLGGAAAPLQILRTDMADAPSLNATLKEVLSRKRWIIAAMSVAFCLSAAWYWTHPPLYSSTVSFYVLEPPLEDRDDPIYLTLRTAPKALKLMATSSAMFDHLIDAFDLGTHYGVPAGSLDQRTRLHGILAARVAVDQRESELISVQVKDEDRAMAAAMANGVFEATCAMMKADQQADLERRLRMYEQVIDSTDRYARSRATELVRLADELRAVNGSVGADQHRGSRSVDMEQALMKVANEVAGSNQDLLLQRRNHMNLLVMANASESGMIRLKSSAMEDLDTSPFRSAALLVLLSTLGTGFVVAMLMLLIIEHGYFPLRQPIPVRH